MTTPARPRKPRRSSGPAPVLASVVIFITSREPGLTWTTASDPRPCRNSLAGRHLKDGCRVYGLVEKRIQHRPSGQLLALAVLAILIRTATQRTRKLTPW